MSVDLKTCITQDMREAMRQKQSLRLQTIRLLLATIKQREIDDRVALDHAGVLKVIYKMIHQRRDAIDHFLKAGRDDLVDKERQEIKFLEVYLPKQLSEEEIQDAVEKAIEKIGAQSMRDMKKVMTMLQEQIGNRADSQVVSRLVKARLNR